jgi:hypothetical protein
MDDGNGTAKESVGSTVRADNDPAGFEPASTARGRQEATGPGPQTCPDGSENSEIITVIPGGDGRFAGQRSGQERR